MGFQWTELVGGLGMFMLGMAMLSNGLKLAAGSSLERILANATSTRLKGLGAGALVTALVQSSSAVTVATIGFVNAGLLSLGSALWVLFGASIGTTTTGWIVAIAGLKLNIAAAALPLIALGVAAQIARKNHRIGFFGEALAGFGMLFYGIMLMQAGFSGVAEGWTIPQGSGLSIAALQLLIGIVMTVVMQSSSASTVIAISAAQAGLIDVGGAAAVVIGANVGTKVTAILAVIGGTPNAKRVATAHVIFHLLAAIIGFLLLPVLLLVIDLLGNWFGFDEAPATSLALFNTTFNVMGVIVLAPWVNWLTGRLETWYVPAEDKAAAKPQFLDRTTLPVPMFAASALANEATRMLSMAWDYVSCTIGAKSDAPDRRRDLFSLLKASESFVDEMSRGTMDEVTSDRVAALLRVRRYLENVLELVFETLQLPVDVLQSEALTKIYTNYRNRIEELMACYQNPETDSDSLESLSRFEQSYQTLKMALLRSGASGQWRVEDMERALHRISSQRRAIQQMVKAQRWLEYAIKLSQSGSQVLPTAPSEVLVPGRQVRESSAELQAQAQQTTAQ
ncbi:Na/Pi cotransporter family protein [Orrella marina]|uniref:Na/Pi-cotransporter II-like protein n=1 Tax=Orrella marina TaxID=2163011 RepID=A0A2R4XIF8_9BURK|nr:Na/Pi symporter [Orrella marina]AWB33585.1 Na/Pi-cotransporter II-like protein [Orrella marina]